MDTATTFYTVSPLELSEEHVRIMHHFQLQALEKRAIPHPTRFVDPDNTHHIRQVLQKMRDTQHSLTGIMQHRYMGSTKLLGIVEQGRMRVEDFQPFVSMGEFALLKNQFGGSAKLTNDWGIFTLLASPSLPVWEQEEVLRELVSYAQYSPSTDSPRTRRMNIWLSLSDPAVPIIEEAGFKVVSRVKIITKVPGVMHRLYQYTAR